MSIFKLSSEGGYSAPAASDLTGKKNLFAKIDSDGNIALCGDGESMDGTITEEAEAGASATISSFWILPVVCAEAINEGAKVASDVNGKAVTAATGDFIAGTCLQASTIAGAVIPVLMKYSGRAA